jgi:hypothetical protein
MEFGMPDDSTKAPDTTQRVAYDKLTEGFGAGSTGRCCSPSICPPTRSGRRRR